MSAMFRSFSVFNYRVWFIGALVSNIGAWMQSTAQNWVVLTQLTGVILQDVPVALSGQGSGTQSTARQVGSALGIAILGTVLFTSTAGIFGAKLDDAGVPAAERDQLVSAVVDSAGGAIAGLGQNPATAPYQDAAREAFSDGTRFAAFTAAGFLAVGLVATLALGSGRKPEELDPEPEATPTSLA